MYNIGDYVTNGYSKGTIVEKNDYSYKVITNSGSIIYVPLKSTVLSKCEGEGLKEGSILKFYSGLGILKRIENSLFVCDTPDGEKSFNVYSLKKVYQPKK